MLDAEECRKSAIHCMEMAAKASDPITKRRLAENAQGWARLAADLARLEGPMEQQKPLAK
jgi:hypothetical protein